MSRATSGQEHGWKWLLVLALVAIFAVMGTGCSSSSDDPLADPTDPTDPTTVPRVSLVGAQSSQLTPAESDLAGSTTTLAFVLDRPAPEALEVNYVMLGNASAFTILVDGETVPEGQKLLIPAEARVLPFTVQAVGQVFATTELQFLDGDGYVFSGAAGPVATFEITLDRLPLAELAPTGLEVPQDGIRNAAVILSPERPPAPPEGLRINYVLVGDPLAVQDEDDITQTPGDPVEGTDPVAGIIEVNNAQPLSIAGGDFAATFQVRRQQPGSVTMILIGGEGYTVPARSELFISEPDSTGALSFSGTGPDVVPFSVSADGAVFFDLTHSGTSNFIVVLRDNNGARINGLVNVIGDFDGTRVEDLAAGEYLLDIEADGDWTANVRF